MNAPPPTPFDPFTATLEEAQAQPDADAERGPDRTMAGAVWRWIGAQHLLRGRDFYTDNPLDGMAVCAVHDLIAPDWLAKSYLRRYREVRSAFPVKRTWEAAFGAPHPKGAQLAAIRRRNSARIRVANVVREFVQRFPSESVEALYRAAGATGSDRAPGVVDDYARRLGVGKTMAEDLYREAVAMGISVSVQELRRRLGRPERPTPAKSRKLAGVKKRR